MREADKASSLEPKKEQTIREAMEKLWRECPCVYPHNVTGWRPKHGDMIPMPSNIFSVKGNALAPKKVRRIKW